MGKSSDMVSRAFINDVVRAAKKQIRVKNEATGKGRRSIKGTLSNNDVTFSMQFYLTGIDAGRRGTKSTRSRGTINNSIFDVNRPGRPPVAPIRKWMTKRGIKPKNKKQSINSLAYVIAKSIGEKGWKANGFFSKGYNKFWKDYPDDLQDAFAEDYTRQILIKVNLIS